MSNLYIDGIGKKGKLTRKQKEFYDSVPSTHPVMGLLYDTLIINIPIMTRTHDKYYVQYNYKSGTYRLIILYEDHQETQSTMGDIESRCKYIKQSKELKELIGNGQYIFDVMVDDILQPLLKVKEVTSDLPPFKEAPGTCFDTLGKFHFDKVMTTSYGGKKSRKTHRTRSPRKSRSSRRKSRRSPRKSRRSPRKTHRKK